MDRTRLVLVSTGISILGPLGFTPEADAGLAGANRRLFKEPWLRRLRDQVGIYDEYKRFVHQIFKPNASACDPRDMWQLASLVGELTPSFEAN